jgi:hypothetical protein
LNDMPAAKERVACLKVAKTMFESKNHTLEVLSGIPH